MRQEDNGVAAFQAKKALKERRHWEWMKEQGHLPYLLQCILIWVGSITLAHLAHLECFKLGWLHSSALTSIADPLIIALVGGACSGQLHWSDMKRKFETLPPGEDWTMK
jgi:hypothetical protein